MSGSQLHAVLRHLHHLYGIAGAEDRSDRQLLRQFMTGDQDAFAALVARHAPLVWGVCRRVLGHRQDAEDAFQAAFFVLARKAGSVRWQASIGGWLYTIAYRLAVRARKRAERWRSREHEMSRTLRAESSLRELGAIVDEELRRLPAKYRDPLLLHYLEGATAEAAARQLGLSRGTFYNRLTRGRELLRGRLTRQGLSLAAPLLAVALAHEAEAVTPSLIQAALRGATESVPQRVAVLAMAAARNTLLTKLQISLALGLLLGTAAGGVAMLTPRTPVSPAFHAERPADPPKADAKPARRVDRHGDPLPEGAVVRLGTLRFRVDTERVEEIAFTPDGKTLAVASPHGLWLFDAATGKQTKALRPPYTSFRRLAFSADGKRLMAVATAGWVVQNTVQSKEVVQIWDVAGGRKTSEVELANVRWQGWSVEGQPLAACASKGEITLHEINTGRKRRFRAEGLPDPIRGVAGPCVVRKNLLAAGDDKGVIHVWETASGEERCVLRTGGVLTGGLIVNSLAFSLDGRWLASLFQDAANKEVVQLWDTRNGKLAHTIAADKKYQYLQTVAFTPDGQTLAVVGWLGVRFWDVASGRERGRTKGEGRTFASSVSFTPDGNTMATAELYCGALHLWDVATGEWKPEPEGHSTHRPGVPAFSPDGKRVATFGGLDGTVRVWDAATGRPLTQIRRSSSHWVAACGFSADGRTLFSCWDDKLLVSDAATGRELHVLKLDDPNRPNMRLGGGVSMYPSGDHRKLITISEGLRVTGWDTTTRKQLFRRPLAFQGAGFWFAISTEAGMLALPHVEDGKGPKGNIMGRGPMYLEKLESGERGLIFPTLKGQTWPLDFSPDGRLLVSITFGPAPPPALDGWGQTLRVWEVLTASELLALPTSGNGNVKATFSPDGRLLAATTPSDEIFLWDLRRGKELHHFKDFDAQVTSLAFSPDGRRLVSGLSDSTLLIWDVAAVRGADKPAGLDAEGAARAWADLGADARRAFAARRALTRSPDQTVPLLKDRLRPAPSADAQRLRRLLADLDSEHFAVREEARKGLEEMGELAEPALRQALAGKPSLEVRRQIQGVLEKLRGPVTRPETLRAVRAVAVLEDIATPEARGVLERLTLGAPEARLTQEAKASLQRLDLRHVPAR